VWRPETTCFERPFFLQHAGGAAAVGGKIIHWSRDAPCRPRPACALEAHIPVPRLHGFYQAPPESLIGRAGKLLGPTILGRLFSCAPTWTKPRNLRQSRPRWNKRAELASEFATMRHNSSLRRGISGPLRLPTARAIRRFTSQFDWVDSCLAALRTKPANSSTAAVCASILLQLRSPHINVFSLPLLTLECMVASTPRHALGWYLGKVRVKSADSQNPVRSFASWARAGLVVNPAVISRTRVRPALMKEKWSI